MKPDTVSVKRLLLSRSLALLCLLTSVGWLTGCGDQSGSSGTQNDDVSGDRLEALVHGPVESAYLEPLKKTMNMTTDDGSQNLEDFDILIFDGDAHEPSSLKEDGIVRQALRVNKWVLGVDLAEAHKQDGLGDVLNAYSCGDSSAYAMHVTQDRNGRQAVYVIQDKGQITDEAEVIGSSGATDVPPARPEVTPETCGENTAQPAARVNPATSEAFAAILTERLTDGLEPLDDSITPPADLIYTTYYFTDTKSFTDKCSLRGKCSTPQTAVLQANYAFTIYLSNANNAQGDFQYVLGQTDIMTTAAQNGHFVNMYGHDGTNWTCCTYDETSDFIGGTATGVTPGGDGDSWVLQDSKPETVNKETTISSGVSFNVGFTGNEPSASFGYSNSITTTVTDWKEDNQSVGNRPSWWYRAAYPFDMDVGYGCGGGQYIWHDGCYLYPAPADLSLDTSQFHGEAVWRTPTIQSSWVPLYTSTFMRVIALACVENGGLGCYKDANSYADVIMNDTYQINMNAVLPVPFKSLTFSPSASVKGGMAVTGTLTVDGPVPVDTKVSLVSDETNASVPPSVTIKQGDSSADFQIDTNANGVAPGGQVVATIKVSDLYGQFLQAQLTLTN